MTAAAATMKSRLAALLNDRECAERWSELQCTRKKSPTLSSDEEKQKFFSEVDPVLGEVGYFQGLMEKIGGENWYDSDKFRDLIRYNNYAVAREVFNIKHFRTSVVDELLPLNMAEYCYQGDLLKKCAKFLCEKKAETGGWGGPPRLAELAACNLPKEIKGLDNKEMFEHIDSYRRIKLVTLHLNRYGTAKKTALKVVSFLQTHCPVKLILAGKTLTELWAGDRKFNPPLNLYTFIPLTDIGMWSKMLNYMLNWMVLGNDDRNAWCDGNGAALPSMLLGRIGTPPLQFFSTRYPSELQTDEGMDFAFKWSLIYVAFPASLKLRSRQYLVNVIALVDDRPTCESPRLWASKTGLDGTLDPRFGEKVLQGEYSENTSVPADNFLAWFGHSRRVTPRKYCADGEGMTLGLDPMHRGFIQGRLPMVDFTTPALEDCLSNPFTLAFRVAETFLDEKQRFASLHSFRGGDTLKIMLLNLCQETVGCQLAITNPPNCQGIPTRLCRSTRIPCPCLVSKLESKFPTVDWYNTDYFEKNFMEPLARWTCKFGFLSFHYTGGSPMGDFCGLSVLEKKWKEMGRVRMNKFSRYSMKSIFDLERMYQRDAASRKKAC